MQVLSWLLFLILASCFSGTALHAESETFRRLKDCDFVPFRFLQAEDFLVSPPGLKAVTLPHSWEQDPDIGLKGFASYRCQVRFAESNAARQMTVFHMGQAYRIWVNGVEFLSEGSLSDIPALVQTSSKKIQTKNLPDQASYDILMQISNFSGAWSGIEKAPVIGTADELSWHFLSDVVPYLMALAALILIALYNSILYFSDRGDRAPLYLALICGVTLLRYLAIQPFHVLQYIFPSSPDWLTWKFEYIGLVLASIFCFKVIGTIFFHSFQILESIFLLFGLAYSLLILGTEVEFYRTLIRTWQVISLFALILAVIIMVRGIREKIRGARLFTFGAGIGVGLAASEIFSSTFLSSPLPCGLYGLLIFCFSNSFILSVRNAGVHLSLQKQRATAKHAFDQLAKIVYPHQLDQMKQGKILEETMPTHISQSVVISFDIVGSSQIQHVRVKEFFEAAIRSCVAIMNAFYDPINIQSSGYRIKEMGDGFLCSVGFPFDIKPGVKLADQAVSLAFQFMECFQKEVEAFRYATPIYCSIGIAYGTIQGYYPQSEPKEYDIHGQAIVLATRYESMRKVLFTNPQNHMLIIQEKIYYSLKKEFREKFQRVAVNERIVIRDDKEAAELFYHLA